MLTSFWYYVCSLFWIDLEVCVLHHILKTVSIEWARFFYRPCPQGYRCQRGFCEIGKLTYSFTFSQIGTIQCALFWKTNEQMFRLCFNISVAFVLVFLILNPRLRDPITPKLCNPFSPVTETQRCILFRLICISLTIIGQIQQRLA